MQVLYFVGLIGLIYASVAGVLSYVVHGAMEVKLDQISMVEDTFKDIEFVINKRLLAEYADAASFDSNFDPETMLTDADIREIFTRASGWTFDNLQRDPWGNDIRVVFVEEQRAIAAGVVAPVIAMALISPGPDRQLQTTIGNPAAVRELMRIEAAEDSDDIIHTFSTQPAAEAIWNSLKFQIDKTASLIFYNYRQQLEEFAPEINQYMQDNAEEIIAAEMDQASLATVWMYGVGATAPINVATAGYPRMPSDLRTIGADVEIRNVVPELEITLSQPGCTTPTNCKLAVLSVNKTNNGSQWLVSYQRLLDGETLLTQ